MRRWTVEGADIKSGVDRIISVEAQTREEAEQVAQSQGLVVSDVHLSSLETKPIAAAHAVNPRAKISASGATTLDVPAYQGLLIGSMILRGFAVVDYLIAVVMFIYSLFVLTRSGHTSPAPPAPLSSFGFLSGMSYALGLGMIGGLLHAAGAACLALRDIAQNSFKR